MKTNRPSPENMVSSDQKIFDRFRYYTVPEFQIQHFSGIRASGMGFLFRGWSFLPDCFPDTLEGSEWKWQWNYWNKPVNRFKWLIKAHIPGRARIVKDEALWISDTWSNSYFFWLTETLPKLIHVRQSMENVPVFMPGHLTQIPFIQQSLDLLDEGPVKLLEPQDWIHFDKLLIPTRLASIHNFNPEFIKLAGKKLRSRLNIPQNSQRRIHICRDKAKIRKFVDFESVNKIFEKYGFENICMEDFSWKKQMEMLAQADIVASIHGAGLANIVVMKPGSKVMELCMRSDDYNSSFYNLAAACGHRYYYLMCEPEIPGLDLQKNNYEVDKEQLESSIVRLLDAEN